MRLVATIGKIAGVRFDLHGRRDAGCQLGITRRGGKFMRMLLALISGALFGIGLVISDMIDQLEAMEA